MKHVIATILFLVLSMPAAIAQTAVDSIDSSPNLALGTTRRNADSLRVGGLNIGLWNSVDTLRGFQLGVGFANVARRMSGVNIGVLIARTMGSADGVQIGSLANVVAGRMHGVQIGGYNAARRLNGLQLGVLSNISLEPMHGFQMGLTNISRGMKLGTQIGLLNINSGYQRGMQMGGYNYTDTLRGLQLGVVNVNAHSRKGYQLGIVNITGDTVSHHLGLVNINPRTRIQFFASAGNYDKLTVGIRFRNRSTYSVVGIGSFHSGLGTSRFSGSIQYRLGQYFNLSPRLSISGDIGFSHIETFREETATRPEHLYSLQARLNLDYRINPHLGVFVSGGYGQTRWYNHHRKFRDKPILEAGLTVDLRQRNDTYVPYSLQVRRRAESFEAEHGDSATLLSEPLFAYNLPRYQKKHPWWALAEDVGINLFVHYFDRFILNADYSKTNPASFARNIRNGFVWDNDQFSTNQFAHPYHGNLYFNAARNNGLNFWESFPYALGGSLMWEFWGETDPPAINDVISTSIGGAVLGEVLYRTSALPLDDSKSGWPRFWQEFAAGVLNPIRALNRIIHGDAWRIRADHNFYHDYNRIPVDVSVLMGARYVADEGYLSRGSHNLRLGFRIEYGDAFADEKTVPYDYFSAELGFNVGSQPLLSDVHLIGRLYGRTIHESDRFRAQWGVFQHFDYYASDSIKGSEMKNPFEISETAAFGPGLVMQIPAVGNMRLLEQRLFLNGIILGGSKSDYYNFIDRDYNIGSGFGWKTITRLFFRRFGNFTLNMEFYHLWTWKGYENKDYMNPAFDLRYLNAQGDKSDAQLFVLAPRYEVRLAGGWHLLLSSAYYSRRTRYRYHPNKNSQTFELTVGCTYHF